MQPPLLFGAPAAWNPPKNGIGPFSRGVMEESKWSSRKRPGEAMCVG